MTIRYLQKPEKLVGFQADKHAILDASAGTGKTYTLEHLVLHLLIEKRMSIDQILVVTFTRRATAELQERVRKQITKMLRPGAGVAEIPAGENAKYWTLDAEARRHLQDSLNQFDNAQIFTIHSFCQNILTGHAFANHQLFNGELVDGDRLFEEAFYEVLRTVYARDSEMSRWLDVWLFFEPRGVTKLLKDLQKVVRSQYAFLPELDDGDFEELFAFVQEKYIQKSHLPDKVTEAHRIKTAVLHKFMGAIRDVLAIKKKIEGLFTFEDMLQLVHDTLYSEDEERSSALLAALRARYKYALVDEFQDTDLVQWEVFKRIFVDSGNQNILCAIGDPKQAIYGFRGADVDTYFSAIEALLAAGAVPIRLDENFRSSPEMIAAYNEIFSCGAGGEKGAFFNNPNQYQAPVQPGPLQENVRHAGICRRVDGEKLAAIEIMQIDTEEALTAGPLKLSFAEGIARRIGEILGGEGDKGYEGCDIFGRHDVSKEQEKITAKDIYVLTRSRGESALIGKTLRRHHIPYSFYREEGLFQTEEARHIYEVLAAICRPKDRSRRLRAYLTPFFGIPLEFVERYDALDSAAGAGQTPHQRLLDWSRLGNARRFRELFQDILQNSGIIRRELVVGASERGLTNYQHLFEILMRQTAEIPGTLEDLTGWFQRLVNEDDLPELEEGSLQRLETEKAAVQVMTIHKSKGLQAKVVFVFGGFNRGTAGPHTFVELGGEQKVPRPKALCLNQAAYEDKKVAGEVKGNIAKFKREEAERLMYVALTRAEALMVLPYVPANVSKCEGDYQPVMDRLHAIVGQNKDPSLFRITKCEVQSSVAFQETLEVDDLVDWQLPAIPGLPDSDDFDRLRSRALTLASYSSLRQRAGEDRFTESHEEDEEDSDDALDVLAIAENIRQTTLKASKISGVKGGNLIHELLEFVDFETILAYPKFEDWCALDRTKSLFEKTIRKNGLAKEGVREEVESEARRMVFNALSTEIFLPQNRSIPGLASLEQYVRELRFVFPIPEPGHPLLWESEDSAEQVLAVNRGYAHGFIDLAFEFEGKTYFADWKSDRLPGEKYEKEALAKRVAQKYPAQAVIYTMATLRMLGIRSEREFNEKFGGFFYFFARGMNPEQPALGVHFESVRWADVVALEQGLRTVGDDGWKKILQGGLAGVSDSKGSGATSFEVDVSETIKETETVS